MTPDDDQTTVVEDQPPQPSPQPEPETPPATAPALTTQPVAEPPRDWRDRQIVRYKERLAEAQRELEELKTRPAATPAPGAPVHDEAEFNRRVDAAARERATQQVFFDRCTEAQSQGRLQFQDFDSKIQNLLQLVDRNDPTSAGAYNALIAAALETGEAPKLVHRLGSDLNEAARVLALSPVKMAVELTKMAAGLEAEGRRHQPDANEISNAPPPLRPIGSRGVSHTAVAPDDPERADNLTDAEWMRRREAQVAARANGAA